MNIREFIYTLSSVAAALIAYGIFIWLYGGDPLDAYLKLFRNAFLDVNGLYETLRLAASLILISSGLSIVFKAGIWNIGAEGQYVIGGLAAGYVIYVLGLPVKNPILPIIVASLVGGIYAAIPGYLKYRLDVNEVLTSLMLNYVALYILYYHVYGIWKDPETFGFPLTPEIDVGYRIPVLRPIPLTFLFSLVLAVLAYQLLYKSKYGFMVRVYGSNRDAAVYSKYNLKHIIVGSMVISGSLAGLAGVGDFLGYYFRFKPGFSAGLGYTAIITTLLAGSNPIYVVISSLFFAGFLYGSNTISIVAGIPSEGIYILEGILLAFLISKRFIERVVRIG